MHGRGRAVGPEVREQHADDCRPFLVRDRVEDLQDLGGGHTREATTTMEGTCVEQDAAYSHHPAEIKPP